MMLILVIAELTLFTRVFGDSMGSLNSWRILKFMSTLALDYGYFTINNSRAKESQTFALPFYIHTSI